MSHTWKRLSQVYHENLESIEVTLLKNRGLSQKKEKEVYLNPPHPEDITPDSLGLDKEALQKAYARIHKAKKDNEKVVVYTDYDVDGVCGGTIIWEGLHKEGLNVLPYIPERKEEGYGLSIKGLEKMRAQLNPSLLITVDNGITASMEIKKALELGIETIVIDHHTKGSNLDAILVHTTKLCAAGIAWYFIKGFSSKKNTDDLDLAALATIADCVPLIGPNRSIVKYGLEALKKTKRLGLNAIINQAGIQKDKIGVFEVGFIIGPRINAMGRVAHALDSLRLMCTVDPVRAETLAALLAKTNKERQVLTDDALTTVLNECEKLDKSEKIIILSGPYNQGIIGLLAGKIVEKYQKPAIVISDSEKFCKASMRSLKGINITQFLQTFSDLLVNVGGHPMAGGFTIEKEKIPELTKKLKEKAKDSIKDHMLKKEISIDCVINIDVINNDMLKLIEKLAPFGIGNPQPLFETKNIKIHNARKIGKEGKHLKLQVASKAGVMDAVAFGFGDMYESFKENVHMAYQVEENVWNGRRSLQMNIKDVIIPKETNKAFEGEDTAQAAGRTRK